MEKLRATWHLTVSSWKVLSKDRELIAILLLAGILAGAGAVGAFLIGAGIMVGAFFATSGNERVGNYLSMALMVVIAVVTAWIVVLGRAAVVHAAGHRMDGGDPTIRSAVAGALRNAFGLFQWAVLSTAVSWITDRIRERAGTVIGAAAETGFRAVTFLTLPVIVFENVGVVEGVKRSTHLLRHTWGEQATFTVSLTIVRFVAALPGVLIAYAASKFGGSGTFLTGLLICAVWITLTWTAISALAAVYTTALYRHAHGLPVDPSFDATVLERAFAQRGD